jgi:hypothetical protein
MGFEWKFKWVRRNYGGIFCREILLFIVGIFGLAFFAEQISELNIQFGRERFSIKNGTYFFK